MTENNNNNNKLNMDELNKFVKEALSEVDLDQITGGETPLPIQIDSVRHYLYKCNDCQKSSSFTVHDRERRCPYCGKQF